MLSPRPGCGPLIHKHSVRSPCLLALGAMLLACGGHGQPVDRERADQAFALNSRPKPPPARFLPTTPDHPLLAFPQDRLRIVDALPLPWLEQLPPHLDEGPQVLTIPEPSPLGRTIRRELLLWVEGGDVRGWMPMEELSPGLYRLRDWWLVFDGRWLERARRYPEDAAGVRRSLERIGRRPDEREIRRHLQAGTELNRDIEAYLVRHGLGLEQAIARTRKVHQDILRQLVGAYFQAFAVAAATLATARELAPLPEDMAAQTRERARSGLSRTRRGIGAPDSEGVPGRTWQSPVVSGKPQSSPEEVEAWLRPFRRRPPQQERAWADYQMRQVGPQEIEVRGGGEKVWADGVRTIDGYLLDTKYIQDFVRSPYIPGSNYPESIRARTLEPVEKEFARYGAVLRDPATPLRGLEVITNSSEAAGYFLRLMERFGIPGRVVLKP